LFQALENDAIAPKKIPVATQEEDQAMSSLVIRNGTVVTLNAENEIIENAAVYIENQHIVAVGRHADAHCHADKVVDARGGIIMPGLINAHHHLYSTFARGFAPPGKPASNFKEILEQLWWKLDFALDAEDVYFSALLVLLDCIKLGCTTVIDHHASPSCRDGSLDVIEKAFRDAGINGCLCYEVSDRNEPGAGIEENERFIEKCLRAGDDQITALFGLHASMTLGQDTLEECAAIGRRLNAGFHVHAAEDAVDQEVTQREFGMRVMERFHKAGITGPKSLFIHGIHLNDKELDILRETDSVLIHNPESNMNNAVGAARWLDAYKNGILVGLGTDGMASAMIASARAAYLLQRHALRDPRVAFAESCELLLKNNAAVCGRIFRDRRGVLEPGALADVAVYDYVPLTPMTTNTFYGHLLFGLNYARATATICRGRVLLEDGKLCGVDEAAVRRKGIERAERLWKRIA
jgi:putative selenium metabolism protein SsnA